MRYEFIASLLIELIKIEIFEEVKNEIEFKRVRMRFKIEFQKYISLGMYQF